MYFNEELVIKVIGKTEHGYIDWMLGNACNYKCSYCFDGANEGNFKFPVFNQQLKDNLVFLNSKISNNSEKYIIWHFAGGEPTLYKNLEDLANYIKSFTNNFISIVTNGSKPVNWWKNNQKLFDSISISFHSEYSDINHIKELSTLLDNLSLINIMIGKHNYYEAINYFLDLSNFLTQNKINNIKLSFLKVRNSHRPNSVFLDLSKEQISNIIDIQNKHDIKYCIERKNKNIPISLEHYLITKNKTITLNKIEEFSLFGTWKGYKCFAPKEFIQIHANGDVGTMSCGQKLFNSNFYNLNFINDFKYYENGIICEKGICGCSGLLESSKEYVSE